MIRVKNLSKHFGDLVVLKDVNVEIAKGEVISVIGPSGTGKSTFLRCLNLLETPTGGEIFIGNVPLLDNLTIGPVKLLGKSRQDAERKGIELLKVVGLAEKADAFPDELSGGQKQRVAIARCMAMEPEILLFDEPTSALDPTMVSEVLAVIRRLSKAGMTMIIVTHEMKFARNTSSWVFYMDEGIIYEEGTPEQIFNNPQREKTRAFINRIRSLNHHISSPDYDLYALQGEMELFCEKHMVSPRVTGYVLHIAEETLLLQKDLSDIDISLSYSEKEEDVELRFSAAGAPYNPLSPENAAEEDDDDIGLLLIKGRCSSVDYLYEEGRNVLIMKISGDR